MKYLLSIIISLFTFSANAELNCLLPENIFGEACEKEREELEKNKKQGYLEEEYLEDEWTVSVVQHEGKDTSDWRRWIYRTQFSNSIKNIFARYFCS